MIAFTHRLFSECKDARKYGGVDEVLGISSGFFVLNPFQIWKNMDQVISDVGQNPLFFSYFGSPLKLVRFSFLARGERILQDLSSQDLQDLCCLSLQIWALTKLLISSILHRRQSHPSTPLSIKILSRPT